MPASFNRAGKQQRVNRQEQRPQGQRFERGQNAPRTAQNDQQYAPPAVFTRLDHLLKKYTIRHAVEAASVRMSEYSPEQRKLNKKGLEGTDLNTPITLVELNEIADLLVKETKATWSLHSTISPMTR